AVHRHARAPVVGDAGPNAARHPRTRGAICRLREGVMGLRELGAAVDEIFTSPLERAKQTADIIAAGLDDTPPVKVLDALAPGHTARDVMTQLAKAARRRRIALVGHEPDLGKLAAHLIGASHAMPFKKGGVARVDVDSLRSRRRGTLIWFAGPKILRKVGA